MPTNPLIVPTRPKLIQPFDDFGAWLSYAEAVKSDTAIRLGIANVPTAAQYANGKRAYTDFFVPICKKFGKKRVNSMFRSKKLNTAIKGSKTSSHMDFLAIDIDCDGIPGITNKELYVWCRANLKFDQLITEFPDENGNPGWIHISYRATGYQRQQCMRAEKKAGQVYYIYE